jgi:hypothetical protein
MNQWAQIGCGSDGASAVSLLGVCHSHCTPVTSWHRFLLDEPIAREFPLPFKAEEPLL